MAASNSISKSLYSVLVADRNNDEILRYCRKNVSHYRFRQFLSDDDSIEDSLKIVEKLLDGASVTVWVTDYESILVNEDMTAASSLYDALSHLSYFSFLVSKVFDTLERLSGNLSFLVTNSKLIPFVSVPYDIRYIIHDLHVSFDVLACDCVVLEDKDEFMKQLVKVYSLLPIMILYLDRLADVYEYEDADSDNRENVHNVCVSLIHHLLDSIRFISGKLNEASIDLSKLRYTFDMTRKNVQIEGIVPVSGVIAWHLYADFVRSVEWLLLLANHARRYSGRTSKHSKDASQTYYQILKTLAVDVMAAYRVGNNGQDTSAQDNSQSSNETSTGQPSLESQESVPAVSSEGGKS